MDKTRFFCAVALLAVHIAAPFSSASGEQPDIDSTKEKGSNRSASVKQAERERRNGIRKVLQGLKAGEISETEARQQLYAFFEEEVDAEVIELDRRIDALEGMLAILKKQRDNPRELMDEKVDSLLRHSRFAPTSPPNASESQ